MSRRGQISIEFILIVTISLVYINFYVWESVESASMTATDIKAVADTKVSAMKLANAMNEAATSSGNMKKTINIFLPQNAMITCNLANETIDYDVMVSHMKRNPDIINCPEEKYDGAGDPIGWMCSSEVELLPSAAAMLDPSGCPAMDRPLFKQVTVQRLDNDITVDWK